MGARSACTPKAQFVCFQDPVFSFNWQASTISTLPDKIYFSLQAQAASLPMEILQSSTLLMTDPFWQATSLGRYRAQRSRPSHSAWSWGCMCCPYTGMPRRTPSKEPNCTAHDVYKCVAHELLYYCRAYAQRAAERHVGSEACGGSLPGREQCCQRQGPWCTLASPVSPDTSAPTAAGAICTQWYH